ncbi:MAG: hypothetical protein H6943_01535 [Zoogloeaceae bacterium]|nr:hypothetical protein [Zoogloeaceae bacterium]
MDTELLTLIALGCAAVWILFIVIRYSNQRAALPFHEQEKLIFGKQLDHDTRMRMASLIPRVGSGRDVILFVVLSLGLVLIVKLLGIGP